MATLIADTGIQFIEWESEVDFQHLNEYVDLLYRSAYGTNSEGLFDWIVDRVEKIEISDGEEAWFRKSYLVDISSKNQHGQTIYNWRKDGNDENLDWKPENQGGNIVDDSVVERQKDHEKTFQRYAKHWIPLPYVKMTQMGKESALSSIAPPRLYFDQIEGRRFKFVLAIQTDNVERHANQNENRYTITDNEDTIQDLLRGERSLGWLNEYLDWIINQGDEELRQETKAQYAARYFLLVKGFSKLFEDRLCLEFAPDNGSAKEVDCFIDFGNSNTCVLLMERPTDGDASAAFKNAQMLELRDLSDPLKKYKEPFPSKVVFSVPSLISRKIPRDPFIWKSPLRIGFEASRIIDSENIQTFLFDSRSHSSSPKRYLCDTDANQLPWRFANKEGDSGIHNVNWTPSNAYVFPDGKLKESMTPQKPHYSNASLTRFTFLEILSHAFSQVNSVHFRESHGSIHRERQIQNVIVSCPTGMSADEQTNLRRYAEEALKIYCGTVVDNREGKHVPEVVPSSKDSKRSFDDYENRTTWMFDEASTTQIMYVYSALQFECAGLTESFNSIHGGKGYVRVASIDIGGGTSDLMVCDYESKHQAGATTLKPTPVFYDSFQRAGDDFQKTLIEELVIQGSVQAHGNMHEVLDLPGRIVKFFDRSYKSDGAKANAMRSAFIQQIGLPVAQWLMDCANGNEIESIATFDDLFGQRPPKSELLGHFVETLGFDLPDVQFKFHRDKFDDVLKRFFNSQASTLMGVVSTLKCDILILGGGTFRIKSLEEMFRKTYHLSQSRIVNTNDWVPGGWHPFINEKGKIRNAKSSVALGSAIAFWANKNILPQFHLDDKSLKTDVRGSIRYIVDDSNIEQGVKFILGGDQKEATISVRQFPLYLKSSALSSPNYINKVSFKIDWDRFKIAANDLGPEDVVIPKEVNDNVTNKINQYLTNAPLKITLNIENGPEKLSISQIEKSDGNTIPIKNLKISAAVMDSERYWLDSGFDII